MHPTDIIILLLEKTLDNPGDKSWLCPYRSWQHLEEFRKTENAFQLNEGASRYLSRREILWDFIKWDTFGELNVFMLCISNYSLVWANKVHGKVCTEWVGDKIKVLNHAPKEIRQRRFGCYIGRKQIAHWWSWAVLVRSLFLLGKQEIQVLTADQDQLFEIHRAVYFQKGEVNDCICEKCSPQNLLSGNPHITPWWK